MKITYFLTAEVHGYLKVTHTELVVEEGFKLTILEDLCAASGTRLLAGRVSHKLCPIKISNQFSTAYFV